MQETSQPHVSHKRAWRRASTRLVPSAILAVAGAVLSHDNGSVRYGSLNQKLVALLGVIIFVLFATAFLQVLTKTIARLVAVHHLSIGRAAALQFILRLIGYITIALTTLDLVGVPVGKLLLGGAALGIILGVAAQQALANFFASIVLIVSHPLVVGEQVTINSGGLGGTYVGVIKDIGLTHTKLLIADGKLVLLPNATLLSGAAIVVDRAARKLND